MIWPQSAELDRRTIRRSLQPRRRCSRRRCRRVRCGGRRDDVIAVVAVAARSRHRADVECSAVGYRPDTGSLRIYFDTVIPLSGRTYLVDAMGNVVVSRQVR